MWGKKSITEKAFGCVKTLKSENMGGGEWKSGKSKERISLYLSKVANYSSSKYLFI